MLVISQQTRRKACAAAWLKNTASSVQIPFPAQSRQPDSLGKPVESGFFVSGVRASGSKVRAFSISTGPRPTPRPRTVHRQHPVVRRDPEEDVQKEPASDVSTRSI